MNPSEQTSTTQQTKQTAQQVADQARQKTQQLTQQAQDTAVKTADRQKNRAAGSLDSMADALRQTSNHLRDQDQDTFAGFTDKAASTLDQFAQDLQNKSVDEMLDDVQDFARREPQLFLGGAVVLGLLASRFFKSSSRRDYTQRSGQYGTSERWQTYNQPGTQSRRGGASTGTGYDVTYSNPGYTGGAVSPNPESRQMPNALPPAHDFDETDMETGPDVPPSGQRWENP